MSGILGSFPLFQVLRYVSPDIPEVNILVLSVYVEEFPLFTCQAEKGGYKTYVLEIKGQRVYSKLKYESGVHRVQRVPQTETQGRVHTSTATVAIMPEVNYSISSLLNCEIELSDTCQIRIACLNQTNVVEYYLKLLSLSWTVFYVNSFLLFIYRSLICYCAPFLPLTIIM